MEIRIWEGESNCTHPDAAYLKLVRYPGMIQLCLVHHQGHPITCGNLLHFDLIRNCVSLDWGINASIPFALDTHGRLQIS